MQCRHKTLGGTAASRPRADVSLPGQNSTTSSTLLFTRYNRIHHQPSRHTGPQHPHNNLDNVAQAPLSILHTADSRKSTFPPTLERRCANKDNSLTELGRCQPTAQFLSTTISTSTSAPSSYFHDDPHHQQPSNPSWSLSAPPDAWY